MGLFDRLAARHPELKRKLRMAKLDKDVLTYVRTTALSSLWLAFLFAATYFMLAAGFGWSVLWMPIIFVLALFAFYNVLLRLVDVKIHRIAKDIDREVLFAGRFLLVKLNAGQPLILALQDASKSYGVANKYFKEIVHDIDIGTSLEDALERASRYSPSEKFRKILFQIGNALKIGVDVTNFLEAILDEIAHEQLIEIQRYGKKLNGLTMFYMLFSIVIPSLGITLFITMMSMVAANFDMVFFLLLAGVLALQQFFSITIFKSIRPTVNI